MRYLVWITVGCTYFLMVWGNLVSATGSGLGCPDWPLCHGGVTPPATFEVIFEWGHRLIAAFTSTLIFVTAYRVWKSSRQHQSLRGLTKVLLAMLTAQILLGGITVLLELSLTISTIHLVNALLVFGGLILIASVVTWENDTLVGSSTKMKRLLWSANIGLLVQLALGGLVRHSHAGLACPNFPACFNSILPLPLIFETSIAFIHRWWGIALLGVFVHVALESARGSMKIAKPSRMLLALAAAQVILGIGTVLSGLHTHTRALHAAVGYALWGILVYISVRAGLFNFLWQSGAGTAEPRTELSGKGLTENAPA